MLVGGGMGVVVGAVLGRVVSGGEVTVGGWVETGVGVPVVGTEEVGGGSTVGSV